MVDANVSPRHSQIGPHTVAIDADGNMTFALHGDSTIEQAREILKAIFDHGDKQGRYHLLLDVSALGDINAGARAVWANVDRPYPFKRTIVYAPKFSKRILITTIYRAGRLLVPSFFPWEIHFAATQEEVRKLKERYWT